MHIYGIMLITALVTCSSMIECVQAETKAKQGRLHSGSPVQHDWTDDYGTVVYLLKKHDRFATKQAKKLVKRENLQGWMTGDYGTLSDFIKNETIKGRDEYPKIIEDPNWLYIYKVMTDESYAKKSSLGRSKSQTAAQAERKRKAQSAHQAEWSDFHQKIEDLMRTRESDDIFRAKRLAEREYRRKRMMHDYQPLGEAKGPRGTLLEIADELQNASPELEDNEQWEDLLEVLKKK